MVEYLQLWGFKHNDLRDFIGNPMGFKDVNEFLAKWVAKDFRVGLLDTGLQPRVLFKNCDNFFRNDLCLFRIPFHPVKDCVIENFHHHLGVFTHLAEIDVFQGPQCSNNGEVEEKSQLALVLIVFYKFLQKFDGYILYLY